MEKVRIEEVSGEEGREKEVNRKGGGKELEERRKRGGRMEEGRKLQKEVGRINKQLETGRRRGKRK